MRTCTGQVTELRMDASGLVEARIACPAGAIPAPGQYVLTLDARQADAALASTVFASEIARTSFVGAAPVSSAWMPGTEMTLRGPFGHGFHLPPAASRIALAALGESAARLLPLAAAALSIDASTAVFTDAPLPSMPPSLEIYPLAALPEALPWADFLALDLPLEMLAELRLRLGLPPGQLLPFQAQALITTPMPCAAAAECGACAVPARGRWKLACQDGPVFDLRDIQW